MPSSAWKKKKTYGINTHHLGCLSGSTGPRTCISAVGCLCSRDVRVFSVSLVFFFCFFFFFLRPPPPPPLPPPPPPPPPPQPTPSPPPSRPPCLSIPSIRLSSSTKTVRSSSAM